MQPKILIFFSRNTHSWLCVQEAWITIVNLYLTIRLFQLRSKLIIFQSGRLQYKFKITSSINNYCLSFTFSSSLPIYFNAKQSAIINLKLAKFQSIVHFRIVNGKKQFIPVTKADRKRQKSKNKIFTRQVETQVVGK